VASDFFEAEDFGIEPDGLLEIIETVAGMEQLLDFHAGRKIAGGVG
jgi:hypothetical protein